MNTLKDKNADLEEKNANLNEIINVVYSLSSIQTSLPRIALNVTQEVEQLQNEEKLAKEVKAISKQGREGSQEFTHYLALSLCQKNLTVLEKHDSLLVRNQIYSYLVSFVMLLL